MQPTLPLRIKLAIGGMVLALWTTSALSQKKYDPGASDTEIRIGNTAPYSGPAAAIGNLGRAQVAYWKSVNASGGINGRKVTLVSLDDGYSPPKTVEVTRQLVEQEGVLATFGSIGTATQSAVQRYLNGKKVPQLLIASGAAKWNNPKEFPWSMSFYPQNDVEASVYAKYILQAKPDAKIAVLYQNDDFGKDFVRGLRRGLGERAGKMIVKEASYEVTDPSVDSQMVALAGSGADTFLNVTTPKFGAQAIRKAHDIGWKPLHFIASATTSIPAVMEPAGIEKSVGIISVASFKVPGDPAWDNDPAMKEYFEVMKRYNPEHSPTDYFNLTGYATAQFAAMLLKKSGDELTRENLLKQATGLKDVSLPMLLPGVTVSYSPDNYAGFSKLRLARFDGKRWAVFSDVIDVSAALARK